MPLDRSAEILDYLRLYREHVSDDALRQTLIGQGCEAAQIDSALKLLGPRPPSAAVQPPPDAAPVAVPVPVRASSSGFEGMPSLAREPTVRKAPPPAKTIPKNFMIGAGVLCGLIFLGGLWFGFRSRVPRAASSLGTMGGAAPAAGGPGGAGAPGLASDEVSAVLKDYKPVPFAEPPHLSLLVPTKPESTIPPPAPGDDAADDYARYFTKELLQRLQAKQGLSWADGNQIAAASTKKNCSGILLGWYPTNSADFLAKQGFTVLGIIGAAQLFSAAVKSSAEKNPNQALYLAHVQTVFGWHMMQDWSYEAQTMGFTTAVGGLLNYAMLAKKLGKVPPEGPIAFSKLALELMAYIVNPIEAAKIRASGRTKPELEALRRYTADPTQLRPYLALTLMAAAFNWSDEEALADQPWPERADFIVAAGRSGDPRAANLGRSYAGLIIDLTRMLAKLPPDQRVAAIAQFRSRAASAGQPAGR